MDKMEVDGEDNDDDDVMEVDAPYEGGDGDEEDGDEELEFEDDDDEDMGKRRSKRAAATSKKTQKQQLSPSRGGRRISSRTNKFKASMAEPPATLRDLELLAGDSSPEPATRGGGRKSKSRNGSSKRGASMSTDDGDNEDDDFMADDNKAKSPPPARKKNADRSSRTRGAKGDSLAKSSPYKSPARSHTRARRTIRRATTATESDFSLSDEDEFLESVEEEYEEEEEEEGEPMKIQRILACRSEKLSKWKEICSTMQTSEIDSGSRWSQTEDQQDEEEKKEGNDETPASPGDERQEGSRKESRQSLDDPYEERFLVKWKDFSFLHCSWETQNDLERLVEGAKQYLNTFFRKSHNGLLFDSDERCDGEYFDPGYTQIERIVMVELPDYGDDDDVEFPVMTAENEDSHTPEDFGILMDKSDPRYDDRFGRQFVVKWCNLPYSDATYEYERDLILNEIEYKPAVKACLKRNEKPSKTAKKTLIQECEKEFKNLYKNTFGERSNVPEEEREKNVEIYKKVLQEEVYPNGGQLRDYQAEGVAWMISNFMNGRSVILADEMVRRLRA